MAFPPAGEPATRHGRVRRRDAAVRRLRRARLLVAGASIALSAGFAAVAYAVTPGRTNGMRPDATAGRGDRLAPPAGAPGPFGRGGGSRQSTVTGGS